MVGALLSARRSGVRHSPLAARHSPLAARHSPLAARHSPLAARHSPRAAPHRSPAHPLGSVRRVGVTIEGLDPDADGVSSVGAFAGERREPRRRS